MADELQARIDAIERELYAPANYDATRPAAANSQRRVTELAEELNRLRAEQARRCAERFGSLAPPGGARLSTGYVRRPEPEEPESWASNADGDYAPIRRFV